jgi:hypothetical protein
MSLSTYSACADGNAFILFESSLRSTSFRGADLCKGVAAVPNLRSAEADVFSQELGTRAHVHLIVSLAVDRDGEKPRRQIAEQIAAASV